MTTYIKWGQLFSIKLFQGVNGYKISKMPCRVLGYKFFILSACIIAVIIIGSFSHYLLEQCVYFREKL